MGRLTTTDPNSLGDDGYIYVLPETLGRGAGSVVDVFTDAGVYLGAMEAPGISVGRGAPPPVVRGGYLVRAGRR